MSKNPRSYKPISGNDLPRFAGIATFMRLPYIAPEEADEVDIGLIGVPWDGGTTNRPGARHGPRQIRDLSTMARNVHHATGIKPFHLCNCADLGDSPVNPVDIDDTLARVEAFYSTIVDQGIVPLTAGGDHLITLPVMRAVCSGEPVGMVHFDAHTDTLDRYFGESRFTHGTPFRRAIEEGLLDPKRTVQIGIRGALYSDTDKEWGLDQGIRVIEIEEYNDLGVDAVIAEARRVVGNGRTYLSFDVDALDPVYAPGTGTPEIGGITTYDAQKMIRGLRGLNLVGGDVVEVSPPFDMSGNTALVAVTMMFEILCLLAEQVSKNQLRNRLTFTDRQYNKTTPGRSH
jgi:guanidinopropionase